MELDLEAQRSAQAQIWEHQRQRSVQRHWCWLVRVRQMWSQKRWVLKLKSQTPIVEVLTGAGKSEMRSLPAVMEARRRCQRRTPARQVQLRVAEIVLVQIGRAHV